jgi:flagellar biosynthetic protein FlhB
MEGDPQVKGRLENARRELLRQNMPKAVREADVLITNPTHFAVALQWKQGVSDAPMVTAKGEDMTAQNMKRIARDADVPTVENRPLARALYTETEVGDIIPQAYLRVIAEVYAHIGYMDKQKRKEAESSEKETQTAENAS